MGQRFVTPVRKYLLGASLLTLTIAAALFARTGAAADTMRIFDWSDAPAPYAKTGLPHSGIAPILSEDRYYASVAANAVPTRSDNLPIAVLVALPQGTTDVAIHATPVVQSFPPNTFLHLFASVRYRFNGQAVYLTTSEPVSLGQDEALEIGPLARDDQRRAGDLRLVDRGVDGQARDPAPVQSGYVCREWPDRDAGERIAGGSTGRSD